MSINFNHVTNDITASSGSVSINGSVPGGGGGGGGALTIDNKTAAYTVIAGDLGKIINCTSGTFTVSLTAAATLGSGFNCWIWNTGTGVITIDPNSTETIDGVSTLILRQGEGTQIVCDGTNWQTGDKKTMRSYAENQSSTNNRPVASGVNAVAIGHTATASQNASLALGVETSAGAINSAAIGRNSSSSASVTATGWGSMALGGSYASGVNSFAAGIGTNISSYGATASSGVALGFQAKATSDGSMAFGYQAFSTNTTATALGFYCLASGIGSVAIGTTGYGQTTASGAGAISLGDGSVASGGYSIAYGLYASADKYGKFAYASGRFAATGDCQEGKMVLRGATTDATPKVITSDAGAATTTNQVILPNNSAYAFSGTIVARQKAANGTASAAWKVEGLIRREGSAGTTTLVASTVTAISNTPGWTLALSADTTNGGLSVTATGAAATNIRWVATIQTSEVTYA